MKKVIPFLILFCALSAYSPQYADSLICLQPEEKKLYDLIMDYRQSLGLEVIPLSAKLTQVAQIHARDLSENHDPTNEKCNLHSWSKKGNWTSCCYTNDHKQAKCMWDKPREIAGYNSNGFEISYYSSAGANAEEGLGGWKKSPGHNRVIINEGTWKQLEWRAIGIGIYKEYGVVWFGTLEDDATLVVCNN
ncbi:MAG: CAP domain-containing protein [Cyclobacteriaceae bacterium]|nr:CAP domain-containing protein [Cyclobacteriaceae bacterium]UYN87392.1 MAG: CAP domain-containing protein [Cyclobacteriaceae bacterium]